jgi:hypothetical protein
MAGVDEVGAHCGLFFAVDADAHAAAAATAAGGGGMPSSASSVSGSGSGSSNALAHVQSGSSVVEYLGDSGASSGPYSSPASASESRAVDETKEADDPPEQYPGEDHKEGDDEEESQHWGERYANLVQDVAGRLEMWVLLAASERMAKEEEEAGRGRWN